MRLFKVKDTGDFAEYKEQYFKEEHDEATLESWLENNSQSIVEDSALLIIGRQVATNLNSYIDLLALDKQGNTAVLELKRGKTPRETIAQALEYASWVEGLEYEKLEQIFQDYIDSDTQSLSEYHKAYFKLGEADAVSFNKEQRIVIVGYDISPEIRQTALFLRRKEIRVTCIEFNYFLNANKEQLLSVDIVIGKEPLTKGRLVTEKRPKTDKKSFLNDLNENARQLFEAILATAEKEKLPIRWGSVGFSLNTDVAGNKVALIMGFPLSSVFSQTIYTYIPSIVKKVQDGEKLAESFKQRLLETGLFEAAGNEVKYSIKQKPTEEQTQALLRLILDFNAQVKQNGLLQ